FPNFYCFNYDCFIPRLIDSFLTSGGYWNDCYDGHDSNGNITIKWDIKTWTPDGYIVVVSIYNFQKYPIQALGWQLGWT
uniref:COBRA-like protein 2 n=1 Tax=Nicotiana tabacum TaxID=4097 RepID=A0A1S4CRA7_TOBAC